eukprot:tig00000949_g5726.t1
MVEEAQASLAEGPPIGIQPASSIGKQQAGSVRRQKPGDQPGEQPPSGDLQSPREQAADSPGARNAKERHIFDTLISVSEAAYDAHAQPPTVVGYRAHSAERKDSQKEKRAPKHPPEPPPAAQALAHLPPPKQLNQPVLRLPPAHGPAAAPLSPPAPLFSWASQPNALPTHGVVSYSHPAGGQRPLSSMGVYEVEDLLVVGSGRGAPPHPPPPPPRRPPSASPDGPSPRKGSVAAAARAASREALGPAPPFSVVRPATAPAPAHAAHGLAHAHHPQQQPAPGAGARAQASGRPRRRRRAPRPRSTSPPSPARPSRRPPPPPRAAARRARPARAHRPPHHPAGGPRVALRRHAPRAALRPAQLPRLVPPAPPSFDPEDLMYSPALSSPPRTPGSSSRPGAPRPPRPAPLHLASGADGRGSGPGARRRARTQEPVMDSGPGIRELRARQWLANGLRAGPNGVIDDPYQALDVPAGRRSPREAAGQDGDGSDLVAVSIPAQGGGQLGLGKQYIPQVTVLGPASPQPPQTPEPGQAAGPPPQPLPGEGELEDEFKLTYDTVQRPVHAESIPAALRLFSKFDLDKDGLVRIHDVRTIMRSLQLYPSAEKLRAVFAAGDLNGDGAIDFSEFLLMRKSRRHVDLNVVAEFKKFDVGFPNRGLVTEEDVRKVLEADEAKAEDIEDYVAWFMSADKDADGVVTFQDLYDRMSGRLYDDWLAWIHTNLERGVREEDLVRVLVDNGFEEAVSRRVLDRTRRQGRQVIHRSYVDRSTAYVYSPRT